MYYFSYGSNMSTRRLRARTPSATKMSNAILFQHQLVFHHASEIDGSAKCNAWHTGNPSHVVHGVLFVIDEREKAVLDRCESLGIGYEERIVRVESATGELIEALTYTSLRVTRGLRPFSWYKEHVLRGAREHKLPETYLLNIDAIECIDDEDQSRHEREMEVYVSSTTGSTSSGH